MKKVSRILLLFTIIALALIIKAEKSKAAEYIWPIGGNNANETYKDYDYYGQAYAAPYKDGKSGREYIVNNKLWPNERYYEAKCESHFGMDISGKNGNTYTVVSVCDGVVYSTSKYYANNPGDNYIDRNRRRTPEGLKDGGGYGNYIIIHEPSTGRYFLYGHLKGGTIKVNKGDTVKVGQEIATMGSSGDSGHMHLHFEIRKNKASMIRDETIYGYHYLASTNSNTNLDPADYIGIAPNVYTPYEDQKLVKISNDDVKLYVRYLYTSVFGREASEEDLAIWNEKYVTTESITEVTKGIFLSEEANTANLSNLDFLKKAYEIILYRGNNYTEKEMSGHLDKLNRGIWKREDFMARVCNSEEFVNTKLNTIINKQKEIDVQKQEEQRKKEEEERKKKEEEEKKKQEEEERKKKEEEEKKRQEEEERKKNEEEARRKEQEKRNSKVKAYVKYLYRTFLGRNALDSETNHWISQYENNVSIAEITKNICICSTTEYMDNSEFVKKIYRVVLNNNCYTESEIYYFTSRLDNEELSKGDFLYSVCNTENFSNTIFPELVKKQKDYEANSRPIPIASEEDLKMIGDLDGDQIVSAVDASLCLMLRALDDMTEYSYIMNYADVDGDGRITIVDAIYILEYSSAQSIGEIGNGMTIREYILNMSNK